MSVPKTAPFEQHHRRYDDWFVRHPAAYCAELLAVRALLPWQGFGLSIGVGTGRFAGPLGVQVGIDPARAVLGYATNRGITAVRGVGEALPFCKSTFDHALCVTTICFLDDVSATLLETRRVLKPRGVLVIGFIDRTSSLGQGYTAHQAKDVFYRNATLFSAEEIRQALADAGFVRPVWVQTLARSLEQTERTGEIEPIHAGYGQNAFVVVRTRCP
ncbi:MAG TPA: class I SAM-dependent methyltransferase [Gammaproteobacteria bacterium]|nr:class I SAM-dependent methyltransferase [Gammaproteobacteria bacterium]